VGPGVREPGVREPGITWYDVPGVLPGAEARKNKREYDAKAALLTFSSVDVTLGAREQSRGG
jgi:hypothetical protein